MILIYLVSKHEINMVIVQNHKRFFFKSVEIWSNNSNKIIVARQFLSCQTNVTGIIKETTELKMLWTSMHYARLKKIMNISKNEKKKILPSTVSSLFTGIRPLSLFVGFCPYVGGKLALK